MKENPPLLELVGVSCLSPDGWPLFANLDFSLRQAGAVLLEGGTGQGKSSLLLSLRGIPPNGISREGTVLYRGEEITTDRQREIGLVLQNPHSQMLSTLVEEELRPVRLLAERDSGAARALHETTIEMLGLRALLQVPTRQLSAGQKHLVAIGSIGLLDYPLLLLDEPFLYLDPASASRVLDYVDYLRDRGTGVVIASHPKMQDANRFDNVVQIRRQGRGGILPSVPPRPVLTRHVTDPRGIPPLSEKAIGLRDADVGYEGAPPLARGLSLTVRSGEESWIVGPNGSGKTTLLKTLAGQLSPLAGERTQVAKNRPVGPGNFAAAAPAEDGPASVYLIPQNPDRFFFESTVLRELLAPLLFAGSDPARKDAARQEALAQLARLGLEEKRDLSPSELSFGERVRLAAAQAALLKPDFLLVDDVLAFCDPAEQEFILEFLRETQRRTGSGLVFATSHDAPREALRGREEVVVLGPGEGRPEWTKWTGWTKWTQRTQTTRSTPSTPSTSSTPSTLSTSSISSTPFTPSTLSTSSISSTRSTPSRLLRRLFRQVPFEFVPGRSLVHRLPLSAKLGVCLVFWAAVTTASPAWFPLVALAGTAYYFAARLGVKRYFVDTQYFVLQAAIFMLVLVLFRRNAEALREGALRGAQVWLFFLPIAVLMRTGTLDQWIALFGKVLSRRKRIVLGVSLGILPCVLSEIKEAVQVQGLKGFVLRKRYWLRPVQFWGYLRAVLVPVVLLVEDMAALAEISVKLRGFEE